MKTHFAKKDRDGNFKLDSHPGLILSKSEFEKLQRLVDSEGGASKWIVFCDYSKPD